MKRKNGFTLVELVIVLAVLAIIIAIAVVGYAGIQQRSKVKSDRLSAQVIAKSIVMRETMFPGANKDEIPYFPKIIKYNELNYIEEFISNRYVPQGLLNSYYYVSKLLTALGERVIVGVAGEEVESIEGIYDGSGPGWIYYEDGSVPAGSAVEVVRGSNLDWNKKEEIEETNPSFSAGSLASAVNFGDYVEYSPSLSYHKSEKAENGFGLQEFDPTDYKGGWRVLSVKEDGSVVLISAKSVTTFSLQDKAGYQNAVSALNSLCTAYVNPKYAISGRSVGGGTVGVTPEPYYFYSEFKRDEDIPPPWSDDSYLSDLEAMGSLADINEQYWIASRDATTQEANSNFIVRYVNSSGQDRGYTLYYATQSGDGMYNDTIGVRAVITLKSSVDAGEGDGSVERPWQLVGE